MGEFANPLWMKIVGYVICTSIAGLNIALLFQVLGPAWMGLLVAVAAAFTIWVRYFYRGS
jgi:manganese transport protein